MTLKQLSSRKPTANLKAFTTKHVSLKRVVRFSIKASPELVGDQYLQSCDTRRRYMRRGSRAPNMLDIEAVRSSAEATKAIAFDKHEERLEQLRSMNKRNSLSNAILRSFSLPKPTGMLAPSRSSSNNHLFDAAKDTVENDLAWSLFYKVKLTSAQKRRLSLEILSRVSAETAGETLY